MRKVSQANLKTKEAVLNGQSKFITCSLEMPVPYSFHTKVSEEDTVWQVKKDVREIISILCKYKDVQIIDGAVCEDHIHLSVAIPPKISISSFMGYLKGKSTLMIYDRHPELQSKWDKSFWARGYYVSTIGNITEDAIKKYIQEQSDESRKEENRSTTSNNACDTRL